MRPDPVDVEGGSECAGARRILREFPAVHDPCASRRRSAAATGAGAPDPRRPRRAAGRGARRASGSVTSPRPTAAGRRLRTTASSIGAASTSRSSRPATSVAVRAPTPASLEQRGAAEPRPASRSRPRRRHRRMKPPTLVVDRQRGGPTPTADDVVVLDDQVAARRHRVPQPAEHLDALGEVEEQQPRVDEVVRATRDRGSPRPGRARRNAHCR